MLGALFPSFWSEIIILFDRFRKGGVKKQSLNVENKIFGSKYFQCLYRISLIGHHLSYHDDNAYFTIKQKKLLRFLS